ncbi:hypothetical protein HAX54_018481 [Datura stramonium]|uniref:Glycosyltransferase N-terminal domain-containing protein n=1 Tax=Datura stramonium TaxID=4076 RepID=A0ABS8UQ78_DATST|nr:hypothetical protein [Datura stramonium]
MAINQKSLCVLMFPWLGHGHISPFLELAKKLVTRNFTIFLCSTPANFISIKQKLINENLTEKIHLVELRLPSLPDLPPQYHTTNGLPPHLMPTLKKAFAKSRPIFTQILNTIEPDLVLYDLLQPWAPKVAAEKNIPSVVFVTSSATMFSYIFHNFKYPPHSEFPFSSIYYRDYEIARMLKNKDVESMEQQQKDNTIVKLCFKRSCDIILIKGFKEIDGKYCDYISNLTKRKVVPVGPLVQETTSEDGNSQILTWLNQKSKGSTVFVSFGSEYFLSQEDREEIAHGLEQSRVNFIWVVRFPKGEKVKLEQALPQGFFKKVGERGMVVEDWAPQAKILGNPNIGGFVSHCGWNSVMESMKLGVPIIAMPMHLDQPLNARLVEESGVGLEVVRDKDDKLDRETISKVINKVVLEKEGESVRAKAKKMSETLRVKGDEEIDDVVQELIKLCSNGERGDGSGSLVNKSNVNEEYVETLRTKSYVEMYNKVQGHMEGGKLGDDNKLSSSSSLQLDTNLCEEALSEIPESCQFHPLIVNYFDITLEACRICELLLQNVQQTRANYRKIRKAIRLMKMEQDSRHCYRELASFASLNNSFSVVNQVQILDTREGHYLLLQKLSSQFRRVNRRMKFFKSCKRVFGVGIAIGYTGLMIALLVLVVHSMVCIVAAPGLIACSYKLLKKRLKVDKKAVSSSSPETLIAQLDVAAKGVYILINDFDTMSRLVSRLYDEIEHNRSVADMCARKKNADMLKEAIRNYSINKNCFMEQLKELEEHVCLCFLTINRSRRMVLQEMVQQMS